MRRNLMLVFALLATILLIVSSAKRIISFNDTANSVSEQQAYLDKLRQENENLKRELEYKNSQRFVESEIRNKLGMAKEGEQVFVVPREEVSNDLGDLSEIQVPNWKKWRVLLFGEG